MTHVYAIRMTFADDAGASAFFLFLNEWNQLGFGT
jgi:hypothetical protein